jgi:hypothetical protein
MEISEEKIASEVNRMLAPETEKLRTKRGELKTWLDSFAKVDGRPDMKAHDLEEFHKRNQEVNAADDTYRGLKDVAIAEVKNRLVLEAMSAPQRGSSFPGLAQGDGKDGLPADPSVGYAEARRAVKSVGRHFTESDMYKQLGGRKGVQYSVDVDTMSLSDAVKTTLSTSAGFAPFNARIDDVVPLPT